PPHGRTATARATTASPPLHDAPPISRGPAVQSHGQAGAGGGVPSHAHRHAGDAEPTRSLEPVPVPGPHHFPSELLCFPGSLRRQDRKSTRPNSSHVKNSYAGLCLKKKTKEQREGRQLCQSCKYQQNAASPDCV